MQPVKKFSCADCNYMARSAACLKQHKRIKHEGVRYPCDECGYAATISSDLRKHKQSIHEGIKYPCDLCEFAASTQSNLKHHKQSKHEGVRFYCDQECFLFKINYGDILNTSLETQLFLEFSPKKSTFKQTNRDYSAWELSAAQVTKSYSHRLPALKQFYRETKCSLLNSNHST